MKNYLLFLVVSVLLFFIAVTLCTGIVTVMDLTLTWLYELGKTLFGHGDLVCLPTLIFCLALFLTFMSFIYFVEKVEGRK